MMVNILKLITYLGGHKVASAYTFKECISKNKKITFTFMPAFYMAHLSAFAICGGELIALQVVI